MSLNSDGAAIVRAINAFRICQLIPTVIVFYDHLITLDEEVDLIWNKPFSVAKGIFLWNRYLSSALMVAETVVFFIPPSSDKLYAYIHIASYRELRYLFHVIGRIFFSINGWSVAVLIWTTQAIMLSRTIAMYARLAGIVFNGLIVVFIGEVATMSLVLATSLRHFDAVSEPLAGLRVCVPRGVPHNLFIFWIPILLFDCVLFGLAVWSGITHRQRSRGLTRTGTYMVEILYKDTLLFSAVTMIAYSANILAWFVARSEWLEVPQGFSVAATTVMGIRLILHLRKAYYRRSTSTFNLVQH